MHLLSLLECVINQNKLLCVGLFIQIICEYMYVYNETYVAFLVFVTLKLKIVRKIIQL